MITLGVVLAAFYGFANGWIRAIRADLNVNAKSVLFCRNLREGELLVVHCQSKRVAPKAVRFITYCVGRFPQPVPWCNGSTWDSEVRTSSRMYLMIRVQISAGPRNFFSFTKLSFIFKPNFAFFIWGSGVWTVTWLTMSGLLLEGFSSPLNSLDNFAPFQSFASIVEAHQESRGFLQCSPCKEDPKQTCCQIQFEPRCNYPTPTKKTTTRNRRSLEEEGVISRA